jgi:ubiquinone/menaquinone biosynthesis C-methylase UbiE
MTASLVAERQCVGQLRHSVSFAQLHRLDGLHAGPVLDVASGLGPVARLAAAAAGPGGRVVASDISAAMLALAAAKQADPRRAPIEYLECPAAAITADDDSFDVVLCQHGLQFFPDRAAAAGEMRRVTRPGGTVVLSTWAAEPGELTVDPPVPPCLVLPRQPEYQRPDRAAHRRPAGAAVP